MLARKALRGWFWGVLSPAQASPSSKLGVISARSRLATTSPHNFLFLFIFPETAQPLQLEHPHPRLSTVPKACRGHPERWRGV